MHSNSAAAVQGDAFTFGLSDDAAPSTTTKRHSKVSHWCLDNTTWCDIIRVCIGSHTARRHTQRGYTPVFQVSVWFDVPAWLPCSSRHIVGVYWHIYTIRPLYTVTCTTTGNTVKCLSAQQYSGAWPGQLLSVVIKQLSVPDTAKAIDKAVALTAILYIVTL